MYTYLGKAQKCLAKGKLEESFGIAAAVAEEAMSAIQFMDDSSGQCGGAIHDSFELISGILADESLTKSLHNYIFDWLHEQVKNPDYQGHGTDEHLEPLFFDVASRLGKYEVAHEFIHDQLKYYEGKEGWGRRYHMQLYLGYQVGLLKEQGKSKEADEIVSGNLQFDEFREIKVTEAIANGAYKQAEKLLLDGIQLSKEAGYAGTTHRWKDRLLKLYDQQTKTQEYHDLARELFLENTSNLDYYDAFKSTCMTDWLTARAQLISDMKRARYLATEHLADVYVKEKMIDELYHLIRESNAISSLIQYTPHLKGQYSSELMRLYRSAIRFVAKNTGRDIYKNLVTYLKVMSKLKGGKEAARLLMLELLNKYRNRPAMKEEFAKLRWK